MPKNIEPGWDDVITPTELTFIKRSGKKKKYIDSDNEHIFNNIEPIKHKKKRKDKHNNILDNIEDSIGSCSENITIEDDISPKIKKHKDLHKCQSDASFTTHESVTKSQKKIKDKYKERRKRKHNTDEDTTNEQINHADLSELLKEDLSIRSTENGIKKGKNRSGISHHQNAAVDNIILKNLEPDLSKNSASKEDTKLIKNTSKKEKDIDSDNQVRKKKKKGKDKHKNNIFDNIKTSDDEGSVDSCLENIINEEEKERKDLAEYQSDTNSSIHESIKPKKKTKGKSKERAVDHIDVEDAQITYKNGSDNFLQDAIRSSEEQTEKMLLENQHLKDLQIVIPWEISLSHRIETNLGRRPTREQTKEFKNLDFAMKNSPFIKQEDKIIQNNFKEFCEQHNLRHDPVPFLNFVYAGKSLLCYPERLKFGQYLGRGLDDRKLHQIYRRFQLLNMKVTKGKFSPQEDKVLMDYFKIYQDEKLKYSSIAKILNRSKRQIQKRYYAITQLEQFTRIPTRQKIEEVVSTLMTVLGVTTVKGLKAKEIEHKDWKRVSALMDDTPAYELNIFWKLSVKTRLFNRNIKINKVLREIIENLHQQKVRDWKELNWCEIAKPYNHKHYTAAFLYAKFKDLKRCRVPKEYQSKPRKCIRMLRNLYEQYPILCNKVQSYEYVDGTIIKLK